MKRHFTAILILMFLTVILSCGVEDETDSDNENGSDTDNGEKTDDPEEIVVFPDPGLEKCVRDEIHQDSGDLLYKDVSMQLFLDCVGKGVENLDGIEKMVSLKYVELGNNKIKDLTPLSKCLNLRELDLYNNEI
ncbi:MAG TPA: leucine-rich repeat domain-containing protein, partial [bacterium]|nr:leucine-rich repeat domain-containing protein [bacterium]